MCEHCNHGGHGVQPIDAPEQAEFEFDTDAGVDPSEAQELFCTMAKVLRRMDYYPEQIQGFLREALDELDEQVEAGLAAYGDIQRKAA